MDTKDGRTMISFDNIFFEGKRRYYIEDLTQRDYSLENTTPYTIEILGNVIEEHAWRAAKSNNNDLIRKLSGV